MLFRSVLNWGLRGQSHGLRAGVRRSQGSLAHDCLLRRVCLGEQRGAGDRETAVTVTRAQDDGARSRLEVVEAETRCDSEFVPRVTRPDSRG